MDPRSARLASALDQLRTEHAGVTLPPLSPEGAPSALTARVLLNPLSKVRFRAESRNASHLNPLFPSANCEARLLAARCLLWTPSPSPSSDFSALQRVCAEFLCIARQELEPLPPHSWVPRPSKLRAAAQLADLSGFAPE